MSSQKDMYTSTTAKIGNLEKSMEEMSTAISGGTSNKKKLETSLRKVVKDEVKAMRDQVTETVSALEKEKKQNQSWWLGANSDGKPSHQVREGVHGIGEKKEESGNSQSQGT